MGNIHFIAIGGAIMHQLALALQRQGYIVTGSDDEINDPARTNLAEAGILPEAFGWFPEKITHELNAIVLGMHARADNPELVQALNKHIPVYSFPEYVYEVSKHKTRIVVAGSHGKTTITSMVMHILNKLGQDFDYLVGARVKGFEASVRLSDAPTIVLEGDEYPASAVERKPKIMFYHPHISVLSGVAWDHINVFPTYENYVSQFVTYLRQMQPGATLIYNATDEEVVRLVSAHAGHLYTIPYQMPEFVYDRGVPVVQTGAGDTVRLSVFGAHNILNLQAAIAVCEQMGFGRNDLYAAAADFEGAARRLEKVLDQPELIAYRDFAHAPSKLKATLDAVREAWPDRELIAVFELHTFSSLNASFLAQYAGSMQAADKAIVFFSHHALQVKGLPALATSVVASHFGGDNLQVVDSTEALQAMVQEAIQHREKPVCLILMSSGTFDGIDWNGLSSQS